MGLTRATLNNIFRQIVIDMAPSPGPAVDTYRYIETLPDLAHQAFGATYQDWIDGTFWSRRFHHAGADPDTLAGGYPVLFAEARDITQEDADSQEMALEVYFVVVSRIQCQDCPAYLQTGMAASEATLALLRGFLKELYTYQYYEVDRSGTVTYEWMSEGRADYEATLGNSVASLDELLPDVSTDEIRIGEWGTAPNERGWYARLVFNLCEPVSLGFDYGTPVVPGLASTVCQC